MADRTDEAGNRLTVSRFFSRKTGHNVVDWTLDTGFQMTRVGR